MPAGDVWGNAWANAWGSSWRTAVTPAPTTQTGGGGSKRKVKRPKRIRYSDFESREAFEKAFRAGIVPPMSEPPPPIRIEEDDDDAVVANLLMLLH